MCGIFGIYNLKNKKTVFNELEIRGALDTMKHRGPDATDLKIFDQKTVLGHLRLSIIDLSKDGNQPFHVDDRYWIVFNGEIFNYLELKEELIALDYTFRTASDTEVLLRAYQHWGEECVQKFNGMWAFCIYDTKEDTIFCSRDRFGVKPFNYSIVDDQFIFSSEIKPILHVKPSLKVPNYNVIANFCRSSIGAQHPETWFENIIRLQPAHSMLITRNGIQKHYRYWQYPTITNKDIDFETAKKQYISLLQDAVKLRTRSDVPVGTTLSGGLDSTTIAGMLHNLNNTSYHTYTATFNSSNFEAKEKQVFKDLSTEFDEGDLVKKVTKDFNLQSNLIKIEYDTFVDDLEEIILHLESGNNSPAVIPLMQILRIAKKDVTVVLEGQGADELLGGYITTFYIYGIWQYIKELKFRELINFVKKFNAVYSLFNAITLFFRIKSNEFPIIHKIRDKLSTSSKVYGEKLRNYHVLSDYPKYEAPKCDNSINEMLRKQHTGGLVNLLHYGDAVSMANSLESRLPFMDYRLVEFVFSLPWHYKLHNGLGKYIHRKAAEGIVPDYILNNPIKIGFATPLSHLFDAKTLQGQKTMEILLSDKCAKRGLFLQDEIKKIYAKHSVGKANYSSFLYRLLCVELWFINFLD